MEQRALPEPMEYKDLRDHKAQLAYKDRLARMVQPASPVRMEYKVRLAFRERPAQLAQRDQLAHKVRQVCKVRLVFRVLPVRPVRLALTV
jgi:hypothetical protein